MTQSVLMYAVAIGVLAVSVSPAAAQDSVAEIQTWRGDSLRINQPSLDSLHTIVPRPLLGPTGAPVAGTPGAPGAVPAPSAAASPGGGSMGTFGTGFTGTPDGIDLPASRGTQGRRQHDTLTFIRDGVEMRVPFNRIASVVVERRAIVASGLPPYVTHAQYSANAVLTDGSTIEAAYVNFGTIILRGVGPQGSIEIPLEDVRTLKITR